MNTDPETRETQNAESPMNFTLDPCPVGGCTAEGLHFHDPERVAALADQARAYYFGGRPMTTTTTTKPAADADPLDLPTVEELAAVILYLVRAQAALDLVRSRVTAWEPIDPDDIKPGMRVRLAQGGNYVVLTVTSTYGHYIYGGGVGLWAKECPGRTWEVDPRTVPAEPEDPRVEVVRGWLKDDGDFSDADVRDLLARLDAMGGESK